MCFYIHMFQHSNDSYARHEVGFRFKGDGWVGDDGGDSHKSIAPT